MTCAILAGLAPGLSQTDRITTLNSVVTPDIFMKSKVHKNLANLVFFKMTSCFPLKIMFNIYEVSRNIDPCGCTFVGTVLGLLPRSGVRY